MTSPFSNWAGGSDAESQVTQARMKALGKRRKSNKKIALEVVEEADKEGEEGKLPQLESHSDAALSRQP